MTITDITSANTVYGYGYGGATVTLNATPTYFGGATNVFTHIGPINATVDIRALDDLHRAAREEFDLAILETEYVQEAPRLRSIVHERNTMSLDRRCYPQRTIMRMAFPWVSTGFIKRFNLVSVFFHNRAWTDMTDALTVFKGIPCFLHPYNGGVCVGDAVHEVLNERITAGQAFWNTASTNNVAGDTFAQKMIDIVKKNYKTLDEKLDEVTKIDWPDRHSAPHAGYTGTGGGFITPVTVTETPVTWTETPVVWWTTQPPSGIVIGANTITTTGGTTMVTPGNVAYETPYYLNTTQDTTETTGV